MRERMGCVREDGMCERGEDVWGDGMCGKEGEEKAYCHAFIRRLI